MMSKDNDFEWELIETTKTLPSAGYCERKISRASIVARLMFIFREPVTGLASDARDSAVLNAIPVYGATVPDLLDITRLHRHAVISSLGRLIESGKVVMVSRSPYRKSYFRTEDMPIPQAPKRKGDGA